MEKSWLGSIAATICYMAIVANVVVAGITRSGRSVPRSARITLWVVYWISLAVGLPLGIRILSKFTTAIVVLLMAAIFFATIFGQKASEHGRSHRIANLVARVLGLLILALMSVEYYRGYQTAKRRTDVNDLCIAASVGLDPTVSDILRSGIPVDSFQSWYTPGGPCEMTALMIAVTNARPSTVKLLLSKGANPKLKNCRGMDCMAIAQQRRTDYPGETKYREIVDDLGKASR